MDSSYPAPTPILAGVAWLSLLAGSASAQIVPAPGPPLAGVCVYSEEMLLGQSLAGVSANQQLAALQRSVSGEIKTANDALVAEARALEARKATTPAAQYQQSVTDLQRRAKDEDDLRRTRSDQLVRTRDQAAAKIDAAAVPALNASLTAHRCAIVLDKGRLYSVNPAMDLTSEVIQKVNASLSTVTVQLAAPATAQTAGAPPR